MANIFSATVVWIQTAGENNYNYRGLSNVLKFDLKTLKMFVYQIHLRSHMYQKAFWYDKGDFCKNNSLLFDVWFSRRFQPPHQEIIWHKPVWRLELWKHCKGK